MRFRHEQTPNNQIPMEFPPETPSFEERREVIKKQYGIFVDDGFEEKEDGWYWKGIRVDKLNDLDDMSGIPYHRGQV